MAMASQAPNLGTFDIVVVGGGPAGSAAAYTAARLGLTVCIIDRSTFPREKLCGGLVTPRAEAVFQRVFGRPLDNRLIFSSDQVSFFSNNRLLATQNGYCHLHFVMRREFDTYLLSLAQEAGASLLLGNPVSSVDIERNAVTLSNGEQFRYEVLIGSDGVNSVVARNLFGFSFRKENIGFGLEVEVPRYMLPTQSDTVEIDFGVAKWGYGWVFPKVSTFTIGIGGIHRLNPDLRESLRKYLALKGVDISSLKVRGQFIPFGDYRKSPGRGNVLLSGDAAGVVDPITGEGIAHAMQTGYTAACAAATALQQHAPTKALDSYLPGYAQTTRSIREAAFWRYLIFPRVLRRPFSWAFADAGTLQRGYLDILAGKHEYNALYGLFALQTLKALRKLLRRVLKSLHIVDGHEG